MSGGSETPCSPVMARRPGSAVSPSSACRAKRSGSVIRAAPAAPASQFAPHREQLGKEGQLEGTLQERDAAGATRSALESDDPLDRLQVAEAPELEVVLEVDELFARLVGGPVRLRVGV